MDEEAIGADQARRLCAALAGAGLELGPVWMHYFRLGGQVGAMEIDAYLHHALTLPGLQRDLLVRAVHQLTVDHRVPPLLFSTDYQTPHSPPGGLEGEVTPPRDPAGN